MRWLLLTSIFISQLSFAASNTLNVYNWADYMPMTVIKQFERETGIQVNYMEYDSNETLYAKLKADPHIGFDVIVPSSYYVQRMAQENMLRRLDHSKTGNEKFLNPRLLNQSYDPNNCYSLPFTWGITGIVVNKRYFNPKYFHQWQDLWKPQYKNQLLMMDDMRELFSIALITLGYSVNDTNPQHIKQAYLKLRQLLPNIKLFNSDATQNIYVDADATLGMGYNGDVYQAQQENPQIKFIFPNNHFVMWIDCLAIAKYAPHYKNALKFINFINRPDVAAKIAINNGYSSPNLKAITLLPARMRNSKTLNPSNQTLQRAEINKDVGNANTLYEKYWQQLKLG